MKYDSVSVITVTNRSYCMGNLINNFIRQDIQNKELIIVINNNSLNIVEYDDFIKEYKNIKLYKLDEDITLGTCLNFAANNCSYPLIAKFDDDDFYSKYYLDEVLKTFNTINCNIVGKTKAYIYFDKYNRLTLKKWGFTDFFVDSVLGSTLCFQKNLLDKVSFRDINLREDKYFCNDCLQNKYKIYSTSIYNHIVFKHSNVDNHTFKYDLDSLVKFCTTIKDNISFQDCFDLVEYIE